MDGGVVNFGLFAAEVGAILVKHLIIDFALLRYSGSTFYADNDFVNNFQRLKNA